MDLALSRVGRLLEAGCKSLLSAVDIILSPARASYLAFKWKCLAQRRSIFVPALLFLSSLSWGLAYSHSKQKEYGLLYLSCSILIYSIYWYFNGKISMLISRWSHLILSVALLSLLCSSFYIFWMPYARGHVSVAVLLQIVMIASMHNLGLSETITVRVIILVVATWIYFFMRDEIAIDRGWPYLLFMLAAMLLLWIGTRILDTEYRYNHLLHVQKHQQLNVKNALSDEASSHYTLETTGSSAASGSLSIESTAMATALDMIEVSTQSLIALLAELRASISNDATKVPTTENDVQELAELKTQLESIESKIDFYHRMQYALKLVMGDAADPGPHTIVSTAPMSFGKICSSLFVSIEQYFARPLPLFCDDLDSENVVYIGRHVDVLETIIFLLLLAALEEAGVTAELGGMYRDTSNIPPPCIISTSMRKCATSNSWIVSVSCISHPFIVDIPQMSPNEGSLQNEFRRRNSRNSSLLAPTKDFSQHQPSILSMDTPDTSVPSYLCANLSHALGEKVFGCSVSVSSRKHIPIGSDGEGSGLPRDCSNKVDVSKLVSSTFTLSIPIKMAVSLSSVMSFDSLSSRKDDPHQLAVLQTPIYNFSWLLVESHIDRNAQMKQFKKHFKDILDILSIRVVSCAVQDLQQHIFFHPVAIVSQELLHMHQDQLVGDLRNVTSSVLLLTDEKVSLASSHISNLEQRYKLRFCGILPTDISVNVLDIFHCIGRVIDTIPIKTRTQISSSIQKYLTDAVGFRSAEAKPGDSPTLRMITFKDHVLVDLTVKKLVSDSPASKISNASPPSVTCTGSLRNSQYSKWETFRQCRNCWADCILQFEKFYVSYYAIDAGSGSDLQQFTDRIAALKINVSQLTSDSVDRNNNSHCWNDKPTGIKSTTSSNAAQLRTVAAMRLKYIISKYGAITRMFRSLVVCTYTDGKETFSLPVSAMTFIASHSKILAESAEADGLTALRCWFVTVKEIILMLSTSTVHNSPPNPNPPRSEAADPAVRKKVSKMSIGSGAASATVVPLCNPQYNRSIVIPGENFSFTSSLAESSLAYSSDEDSELVDKKIINKSNTSTNNTPGPIGDDPLTIVNLPIVIENAVSLFKDPGLQQTLIDMISLLEKSVWNTALDKHA